ncbi:hypothetical protein [Aequorivita marina]|uniref:hypothetical protein n=1 Tax=Aequorivita marina TaxID=3073654 RepID=UPI002876F2C5|nr:hypothetical protein [Aequorivita sp. S2608]MDS1298368.1 hypothetical protein [Aequorivita sp. S2608]
MLKERINIENIDGQLFEIKIIDPDNSKPASFTHYLIALEKYRIRYKRTGFPLQSLSQNIAQWQRKTGQEKKL